MIDDGHISRVGVFLPYPTAQMLPNHYGTSHRAALGLTELSDAMVIAVFEERGEVSLATGSTLRRIEQPSDLVERMRSSHRPASAPSGIKFHSRLFGRWRLKLSALGIAAVVCGLSISARQYRAHYYCAG